MHCIINRICIKNYEIGDIFLDKCNMFYILVQYMQISWLVMGVSPGPLMLGEARTLLSQTQA